MISQLKFKTNNSRESPLNGSPYYFLSINFLMHTNFKFNRSYIVKDSADHVSVHPIGETLIDWVSAGSSSVWTKAVKSAVIKWDGVN